MSNVISKMLNKFNKSNKDREIERLRQLPRYTATKTDLFGKIFHLVDAPTYLASYKEIFEHEIYKFETDNPRPVIIDCGANIGLSALYFKLQHPGAVITAFEPDPKIFNALKQNIDAWQFDDVSLVNAAIWTTNESISFNMEGGHSGRIPYHEDEKIVEVKAQRLRDLMTAPIDFLKLDIEGAENSVFYDIDDRLHFVDKLFLEYHSHLGKEQLLGDMLNILARNGFRYYVEDAYHREMPFVNRQAILGMDLQVNVYAYRSCEEC